MDKNTCLFWNNMIFFVFFQDESPSGCISSGGSTAIMGKQLFVRLLAMTSTLMAGSLVFLVSGNTDLYEVVFKTTGIILGTLLAIYILGK